MPQTTFTHMVSYGKTYRPASEAAEAALAAGDNHLQVIEELAMLIAVVCDACDVEVSAAHDVIDHIAKVQPAARMITDTEAAEA